MLISLAWKNIWRNKKRSVIILIAIALGLWAGLFASSVMFGAWDSAISSAIDRELSDIQIHSPQFVKEKLINNTIPHPDKIINILKNDKEIFSFSERVVIEGMVSSPTSSVGVEIMGIDPGKEKNVTSVSSKLLEGNYLEKGPPVGRQEIRNPILVGEELAKKLGLKLKSKMVLSFQTPDGSIAYAAFRIEGIFKTESSTFDKSTVFVRRDNLYSILGTTPFIHEIAIRLNNPQNLETAMNQIQKELPNLSVQDWKKIAPELDVTYELLVIELYVFLAIILLALLFGVTNTMLMSVIDRIRELGVLLAVGMKRGRIFVMIIYETIMLSLCGGILGMIFGSLTILYFSDKGINLSAFSAAYSAYGISTELYPALPISFYPILTVMIILTAIFAAVYPAVKAIKLRPAEAIRTY
jgi:ABC-type lipoprotein release transport system permease subunit